MSNAALVIVLRLDWGQDEKKNYLKTCHCTEEPGTKGMGYNNHQRLLDNLKPFCKSLVYGKLCIDVENGRLQNKSIHRP